MRAHKNNIEIEKHDNKLNIKNQMIDKTLWVVESCQQ